MGAMKMLLGNSHVKHGPSYLLAHGMGIAVRSALSASTSFSVNTSWWQLQQIVMRGAGTSHSVLCGNHTAGISRDCSQVTFYIAPIYLAPFWWTYCLASSSHLFTSTKNFFKLPCLSKITSFKFLPLGLSPLA